MSDGPISLSLADIAMCVQVIDVCSRRGAIAGAELQLVGALRNRLAAVVDKHAPAEEKTEPVEGSEPSTSAAGEAETAPDTSAETDVAVEDEGRKRRSGKKRVGA